MIARVWPLLLLVGCSTPAVEQRPLERHVTPWSEVVVLSPSTPHIYWHGQVDQRYTVEWTPFQFAQWVDVSGWLHYTTTNMGPWPMDEEGAYRIMTECWP